MKSLMANKRILSFIFCMLICVQGILAQIPDRPVPAYAVNDFSGVFSLSQRNDLERRLVKFSEETSNRIVVVTVDDLGGMEPSQFSYQLGQKWGVGSSKFDNGIVILIKPKTGDSRGQAFVATGYGLEGVIPDAIAKRIVDQEMIPHFRVNDYYSGVKAALDVIIPLVKGEISYDEWAGNGGEAEAAIIIALFFAIIFVVVLVICSKGGNGTNLGSGNRKGPSALDLILLSTLLGGRSGFRGGSGGFGGGGGFHGGFGGGSFGGGGAGGSW